MKKITFLFTGLTLIAVGTCFADQEHKNHERHAGHMLGGYEKVASALYLDKLDEAKAAATRMAAHDENSTLTEPALAIAKAESLEVARTKFKELSVAAIKLAENHDKNAYVVMNCPMVKGGGGDWLQRADSDKVYNPYFGSMMPHCGGPKKSGH